MQNKTILLGIGGLMVTFGLLYMVYLFTNAPTRQVFPEIAKIQANDHRKWSTDNKIVLVEYSDFQCPACKSFHDLIKGLEKEKGDGELITKKVTFIYRHFPLDAVHLYARDAAFAAEAASKQGKFFEMGDLLFDRQEEWAKSGKPKELFVKYAEELKLDRSQFEKDMGSKEVKERVQADVVSGSNADVQGTPTFYLNGEKLNDIQSFDDFKKLLIEKAKAS